MGPHEKQSTCKCLEQEIIWLALSMYDDIDAGNSLENNILRDKLKECAPIKAITKTFQYSDKNETVAVQGKQFPLKLGHVITVHNYQGFTL